jgi:hypothetical protein
MTSVNCLILLLTTILFLVFFNFNMTSNIGYINNTMIKVTIYLKSHMRIDEHHSLVNSCIHIGTWCTQT